MQGYNTDARKKLLAFLAENPDETYTVETLSEKMTVSGSSLPKSTLYRLLGKLCEEGEVVRLTDERTRKSVYGYRPLQNCKTHLHLQCSVCGRLTHLEDGLSDALLNSILNTVGFEVNEEEAVLPGVCNRCRQPEKSAAEVLKKRSRAI